LELSVRMQRVALMCPNFSAMDYVFDMYARRMNSASIPDGSLPF
jgi:hypothetical protein